MPSADGENIVSSFWGPRVRAEVASFLQRFGTEIGDSALKARFNRTASQFLEVTTRADDPENICPPWWPQLLWQLHGVKLPGVHVPTPGPINYPPAIQDMMAALAIHTFSYLLLDQQSAQGIRNAAEARLVHTAQNLSKLHDASVGEGR